ncbi:MAG: NrpR regulatory domain-containing protein [Dehalococcoidales bacterium]
MSIENHDIGQKQFHILKVLEDSKKPLGSRIIAKKLQDIGIRLEEGSVRYHLRFMDERGLTRMERYRDGRTITQQGLMELRRALVGDKVGLAISKIETLAFRTDFNPDTLKGSIPVNISFFPQGSFNNALRAMKPVFQSELCVSNKVKIADGGERIGDVLVPEGMVGFATVCSIAINGALLKAGVPVNSKFGGVLQMSNNKPLRFVELIHYSGSSLDPSEIFIRAGMTSVNLVNETGNGEILANFREIPAVCQLLTMEIARKLAAVGIGGIILMGNVSEPVCEIPVDVNRVGIVLIGGLNPVAAALELGIGSESHAMSTLVEYHELVSFNQTCDERS